MYALQLWIVYTSNIDVFFACHFYNGIAPISYVNMHHIYIIYACIKKKIFWSYTRWLQQQEWSSHHDFILGLINGRPSTWEPRAY